MFVPAISAGAAGINAAEDSSDFMLDCNSRAGYDFLGTMENGEELQAFYNRLYDKCVELWDDTDLNIRRDGEHYCYGEVWADNLSFQEMVIVYYTMRNDCPIFYFADPLAAARDDTFLLMIDGNYRFGSDRKNIQEEVEYYIKNAAAQAENKETDYLKAKAVHDILLEDLEYAFDRSGSPSEEAWAHNVVGATKNSGTCETYARLYQAIMNYMDIDNYFVSGLSDGGEHAWNAVRLDDGLCYYVDCTWDDLLSDYTYFAKGEDTMSSDHTADTPTDDPQRFLIRLPDISRKDFDPENAGKKPEFKLGDANNDGVVNVTDISMTAAHLKGIKALSSEALERVDMNGDGFVTVTDVSALAATVKGIR